MNHDLDHNTNLAALMACLLAFLSSFWHWVDVYHYQISTTCTIICTVIAVVSAAINGFNKLYKWWKNGS